MVKNLHPSLLTEQEHKLWLYEYMIAGAGNACS